LVAWADDLTGQLTGNKPFRDRQIRLRFERAQLHQWSADAVASSPRDPICVGRTPLALVKQLVQLHGGSVTVASEGPGKGSAFAVQLPLLEAKTETPIQAAALGYTASISG
jgi:hypothetical protein